MFKKIAITGPECSGKSTLAKQLGDHFNATVIDEYAREYLEKQNGSYSPEDVETIAEAQFSQNNTETKNLLISDTEMLVNKVWFEEKYKYTSQLIEKFLHQQEFNYYLLCKPDIPWEFDKLRENPSDRERIYLVYKSLLKSLYPNKFIVIEGSQKERFEKANEIISDFI